MAEEKYAPEINQGMFDLTKKIIELREKHSRLRTEAAEIWQKKEKFENTLVESMESLNISNFRHKEFGLVSVGQRIYARITDAEKAREYFEKEGLADQLLENRLKQEGGQKRLNEIVKDCIENGQMVPEGLDYSSRAMIRISQG